MYIFHVIVILTGIILLYVPIIYIVKGIFHTLQTSFKWVNYDQITIVLNTRIIYAYNTGDKYNNHRNAFKHYNNHIIYFFELLIFKGFVLSEINCQTQRNQQSYAWGNK